MNRASLKCRSWRIKVASSASRASRANEANDSFMLLVYLISIISFGNELLLLVYIIIFIEVLFLLCTLHYFTRGHNRYRRLLLFKHIALKCILIAWILTFLFISGLICGKSVRVKLLILSISSSILWFLLNWVLINGKCMNIWLNHMLILLAFISKLILNLIRTHYLISLLAFLIGLSTLLIDVSLRYDQHLFIIYFRSTCFNLIKVVLWCDLCLN